jgi:hypothetical protein
MILALAVSIAKNRSRPAPAKRVVRWRPCTFLTRHHPNWALTLPSTFVIEKRELQLRKRVAS